MTTFTENLRYVYDLSLDSLVIDAGSHEGNFANLLCEKYGCSVLCFEPIAKYAKLTEEKLKKYVGVMVFNLGIGGRTREETFRLHGNRTGIASQGDEAETVVIRDIAEVLQEFDIDGRAKWVDLLKLNVEGMEFEILERIIELGLAPCFKNIQVQFHSVVADPQVRRAVITEKLSHTHNITWIDPQWDIGWVNWRLKA